MTIKGKRGAVLKTSTHGSWFRRSYFGSDPTVEVENPGMDTERVFSTREESKVSAVSLGHHETNLQYLNLPSVWSRVHFYTRSTTTTLLVKMVPNTKD